VHIFQLARVLVDREREHAGTPDSGQADKRDSLWVLGNGFSFILRHAWLAEIAQAPAGPESMIAIDS
jgi:hypothetical protein